ATSGLRATRPAAGSRPAGPAARRRAPWLRSSPVRRRPRAGPLRGMERGPSRRALLVARSALPEGIDALQEPGEAGEQALLLGGADALEGIVDPPAHRRDELVEQPLPGGAQRQLHPAAIIGVGTARYEAAAHERVADPREVRRALGEGGAQVARA